MAGGAILIAPAGCGTPSANRNITQEAEALRRQNRDLMHSVARCEEQNTVLEAQIRNLAGIPADRPSDVFHPVAVEIASLSGGANYDEAPGDDGVTVHLRLRDSFGDIVKVPGRIAVQLLDTSTTGSPRLVGVCEFDDPAVLGRMWHGRFGTNHFSLRCPFTDRETPRGRKLTVNVEFVDYVTGRSLTAVKEVSVIPSPDSTTAAPSDVEESRSRP